MPQVDYKYIWNIEPAPTTTTTSRTTSSPSCGDVLSSLKNTKEAYLEAVRILLVLLDNVLKNPNELKYRTIRMENKTIKEKLLSLEGSRELLTAIGFKRMASEYKLPMEASLEVIREYRDVLLKRREYWENRKEVIMPQGNTKTTTTTATEIVKPLEATRPYKQRITYPRVLRTSNNFLRSLELFSDAVMQYEDEKLLAAGRDLIPIDDLTQKASEKLMDMLEDQDKQLSSSSSNAPTKDICIRDLILVELVNWFNTEFFEWVNNIPCKVCGSEESKLKRTQTEGECRVEVNVCCGEETKFYRYNDIAQLLVSRKGRCGEYANCFTFFCRCLDYDARIVHSLFDHVWTEVYSESQSRWLHVDPSDNVIDSPLMYQHGWKRNIDYIFAYSCDDIQDVTWRYCNNHKATLLTRRYCTENELIESIIVIRKKRQANLTDERKKCLSQRCMLELMEMTVERAPTENELKGRSSGSLTWRQSRGENTFNNIYVFTLTDEEIARKEFNLRYSCVLDVYERYYNVSGVLTTLSTHKTWQSCIFSAKNIFRNIESTFNMVYLARQADSNNYGEIVWRFDFSKAKLKVKNYSLNFKTATFEEGKVELLLIDCKDNNKVVDSLNNCQEFEIYAKLLRGTGDAAWQHAQLFRQDLKYTNYYPFKLQIELTSDNEENQQNNCSSTKILRQPEGEHALNNLYEFSLTEREILKKEFNLRYSCNGDIYERYLKDDSLPYIQYKYWQSCLFTTQNIFYKVDNDWETVSLTRIMDSTYAEIVWKFNFSQTNLKVKNYKLHFKTYAIDEGKIELCLRDCKNNNEIVNSLENLQEFTISAKLSGSKVGCLDAQLFRQSFDSNEYPFDLQIVLMEK